MPVLIINDLRHFYGKNTLFLELSNLLHKKLGLAAGYDADLVCFDENFQVTRTLVAGQEVYSAASGTAGLTR